jgi:hypothetical protein
MGTATRSAVGDFGDEDKEKGGAGDGDLGVEPPVEDYLVIFAVEVEKVLVDSKDGACGESYENSDEGVKSGQGHGVVVAGGSSCW